MRNRTKPERPPDLTNDLYQRLMERARGYRKQHPNANVVTAVRAVLHAYFYNQNNFGSGFNPSYVPWRTYLISQFAANGGRVAAMRRQAAAAAKVRPWGY